MKNKGLKNLVAVLLVAATIAFTVIFNEFFIYIFSELTLLSAKSYLPDKGVTLPVFATTVSTTAETTNLIPEDTTAAEKEVSADVKESVKFTDTPDDIKKVIAERKKTAAKDKKGCDRQLRICQGEKCE